MSLKGLRFTLEVDGQEPDTFAVVNFRLIQNQSSASSFPAGRPANGCPHGTSAP